MTIALFTTLTAGPDANEAFAWARDRALAAQDSGIDAVILSDRRSIGPHGQDGAEAGTLAAALAVATDEIGLVPTISTEHAAPYHVARMLATVDHLCAGRAGWAIGAPAVAHDAANHHSRGPASPESQRSRADEFALVLTGLWDSFQDDAFLRDRESGVYFVPERLHTLDHRGEHFTVAGPLNIARPPQGHPVLVRRISCAEDVESAGRFADVVIVPAGAPGTADQHSAALADACRAAGRRREDVRLLLEWQTSTPVVELLREAETCAADGFVLAPSPAVGLETVLETARAVRRRFPVTTGATLRERLRLGRPAGR